MSKLLRPEEMIVGYRNGWNGRRRGWAVDCLPDGSAFTQYMPVYKTKREALHWATCYYVSHRARHDLGWDADIDEQYRRQYDAVYATAHEHKIEAVLREVQYRIPEIFTLVPREGAESVVRPTWPMDAAVRYACDQLMRLAAVDGFPVAA